MVLKAYYATARALRGLRSGITPYVRRGLRFLALPRIWTQGIAWATCPRPRPRVALDLLWIFFRLKTYPSHYSRCRLWEVPRDRWHLYYAVLTDAYQKRALTRALQPPAYALTLGDKEVCHHLLVGLGAPVPGFHGCVDPGPRALDQVAAALATAPGGRLVVKPVAGTGGRAIQVVERVEGRPVLRVKGEAKPLTSLEIQERCLLQEAVVQHPALAAIYAGSVNTLRLQTMLKDDGEPLLLGALFRFGRNQSAADNMGSGGLGVGVDVDTGRLLPTARDLGNRPFDRHPETGIVFEGYAIPHWEAAVALALRVQRQLAWYRLVGFDLAFTEAGPVIIEINPQPENVSVEALSGPLLGRPEVARAFLDHGLLVNEPSRAHARSLPPA